MDARKSRHFLAQFYGDNDNPGARYRKCNLVTRAIYPTAGIRSFAGLLVRIVGINESGAILQSTGITLLPEHFYICLGAGEIFLTCARKRLSETEMFVSFSRAEEEEFIDALCNIGFPLSPLTKMSSDCAPEIENRIRASRRRR